MEKFIKKDNWRNDFVLIGKPIIKDWTYKLDAFSEASKWQYNVLNLDVDCGEKYGTVRAEMMGGFSADPSRSNTIYAHGKNEDGSDNFADSMQIDWDDRFNPAILNSVGKRSFITIGLEKTTDGDVFKKNFLSAYDAIKYVNEHLTENMIIKVNGRLEYSEYNGKVQMRKKIENIELMVPEEGVAIEPVSHFTQSILIDKDSVDLKDIDTEKGVLYVTARVLDYVKEKNGHLIKGQYPYYVQFEYPVDVNDAEQCKLVYDALFNVKKDVTQITFNGNFIESGASVVPTWDDVPENIQKMVKAGVFTEEQAIQKCSTNGNKEKRIVLGKPHIKIVGEQQMPQLQLFPEKYTEEDLDFSFVNASVNDEELPFDVDEKVKNVEALSNILGNDWLN